MNHRRWYNDGNLFLKYQIHSLVYVIISQHNKKEYGNLALSIFRKSPIIINYQMLRPTCLSELSAGEC
jgi:hypothetical protein